jgi:hypothetical protein
VEGGGVWRRGPVGRGPQRRAVEGGGGRRWCVAMVAWALSDA